MIRNGMQKARLTYTRILRSERVRLGQSYCTLFRVCLVVTRAARVSLRDIRISRGMCLARTLIYDERSELSERERERDIE